MSEHPLQPLADLGDLEQLLFLGDLEVEMARHRVGELRRLFDLVERDQDLGSDLLVQLDVLLELRHHRAAESFELLGIGALIRHRLDERLEVAVGVTEAGDLRALAALHQHLHRAVRELEQLQDRRDSADTIDIVGGWIILCGVLLRHQQDLLVILHHRFERTDRFLAPDEQRHNHVGKYDDIAQWQHGQHVAARGGNGCCLVRCFLVRASLRFRRRPIRVVHG